MDSSEENSNVNEEMYSSSSQDTGSASNVIKHVIRELPSYEDFEDTSKEEKECDDDEEVPPSGDLKDSKQYDDNFPPSEDFQGTNDDLPESEDFQGTNDDFPSSKYFPPSEDFCGIDDDIRPSEDFNGTDDDSGEEEDINNGENDFPQSEDFNGRNDDFPPSEDLNVTDDEFPPSEDFNGTDDEFPPSEDFNGTDDEFPPSEDFNGTDDEFPPSEDFNGTDDELPPSEDFNGTDDDLPPSEDFNGNDGDYHPSEDFNGTDDDFPPSEDFNGTDDDFSPSEDFNGTDDHSVDDEATNDEDSDSPFSEEFSGTNNVDGHIDLAASDHDNNFHNEFGDEIFNEGGHMHHNENNHPAEDVVADIMVQEIQRQNPMQSRIKCRTRPFYVNPKHSSYTRSRKELLTSPSSITHLISSECCHKSCLKSLGYNYVLERRKMYLSMNKSMQNSYLVGCMISTRTGYDYRVGRIMLCRKAFKRIHSIGNLRLSRIQTRLEKDPTFYTDDYQGRITGPSTHIAISWMHDFFSKHGESMPNRETIHIPDNFTRQEIYNLYKDYVQGGQGNDNFIRYAYFTRVWKKKFNNVRIPKMSRMGVCSTCASIKERRDRSEGIERGMFTKQKKQIDKCQLLNLVNNIFCYVVCRFHNQCTARTSQSTIK